MNDLYDADEARAFLDEFGDAGAPVAERVYTSRLLGRDPRLVLHGGGNTSVKTVQQDLLGRDVEVLCVKGSGWDLVDIEPPGLPACRLEQLRELRTLDSLPDEGMVQAVRATLLDSRSPNPSVEALLHAFLPHAFVDHTHANAILTLTDQQDPEHFVRAAFGDALGEPLDVVVLPWIMPGFPLAKAVADAYERHPSCIGVVLAKHGLFTFGDTAEQSYRRTIDIVTRAERYLAQQLGGSVEMLSPDFITVPALERVAKIAEVLPTLRGACAESPSLGVCTRTVAEVRLSDEMAAFGTHADARRLCESNPITPDHVIRTKGPYLHLDESEWSDLRVVRARVAQYEAAYRRYYEASACEISPDHMHSPKPIVCVLAGLGLVALHNSKAAACIAADIAEHSLRVKAEADALGGFVPLSDRELAEMEYWPLEVAKLGKKAPAPLAGRVALVTGGAGAIGLGIAEVLLEHGACVFLTDVDGARLESVVERLRREHRAGGRIASAIADLTDEHAVRRVFEACAVAFGGVDCIVPNAGVALVRSLREMRAEELRRVLDVNTTATMLVLQQAERVLREQGTGGSVVLQASKNVFAPGASFGAYSASKAAALQLGRIAALEFADMGVRVNMINADAVFGDDVVPSKLWQDVGPDRMRARGLDEAGLRSYYRDRSLLKATVTPRHVGEAVAWFARELTPTTGAVLPIDGGVAAAFPR
ncbi:MAG: bifunctional aldolase/short-chain dehydrogenase [Planctomycetota bacterium]